MRLFSDRHISLVGLSLLVLFGILFFPLRAGEAQSTPSGCDPMGWFPADYGLKDHTVFWHAGYYYLMANYIPSSSPGENFFAYGRSLDLCTWEDLTPVLAERIPGAWDEMAVWAPFVLQENGTYYTFYTGVTSEFTQSIMLATTASPDDPASWLPQGMIFQPNHVGMLWESGQWADCRDPVVLKQGDTYYLYYTGLDYDGGIIGMATANSPFGPWTDWGRIFPARSNSILESPAIVLHEGLYYLFYNQTGQGELFQVGVTLAGPWQEAFPFHPGWAHEVWQDVDGAWYTSYLTRYSVTISPLTWDPFYLPPHPFIGSSVYHSLVPLQASGGH